MITLFMLSLALTLTVDCGGQLKSHVESLLSIVDGNENTSLRFRMITRKRKGPADTAMVHVRRNGAYKRTEIGKSVVAEDRNNVVFIMHAEKRILVREQHPDLKETPNALAVLMKYLETSKEPTCDLQTDGSTLYSVNLTDASKAAGPATRMNISVDAKGSITNATTMYSRKHPEESMSVDNIALQVTQPDKSLAVPALSLVYDANNRQRKEFKNYTILDMRKNLK